MRYRFIDGGIRRLRGLALLIPFILLSDMSLAEFVRPMVHIVVAKEEETAPDVIIPGDIEARYVSIVSFRLSGKIIARLVDVGSHITADQVIAVLSPEAQQADFRSAEAALVSAKASLAQANLTFQRQSELIKDRFTTGPAFDQAKQAFQQAQSQVRSNEAQLGIAKEKLSYTNLRAGINGVVTSRSAEVGQVVNEGIEVFRVAQDGPRDAVFSVYESLLAKTRASSKIKVSLQSAPNVEVLATVREVSPVVDTSTGAVKVKASLDKDVPGLSLGASVIGTGRLATTRAITLPWSALFKWQGSPAVWVVADGKDDVQLRKIVIERYQNERMVIRSGIRVGDRVVTAGIQFLRPGISVQIVETPTQ